MMKKIYSYPETALLVLAAEGVMQSALQSQSSTHVESGGGEIIGGGD